MNSVRNVSSKPSDRKSYNINYDITKDYTITFIGKMVEQITERSIKGIALYFSIGIFSVTVVYIISEIIKNRKEKINMSLGRGLIILFLIALSISYFIIVRETVVVSVDEMQKLLNDNLFSYAVLNSNELSKEQKEIILKKKLPL